MSTEQFHKQHVHPEVIGQVVNMSRPPLGQASVLTDAFGQFTADFVVSLLQRAKVQISDISLQGQQYEHSAIELTEPLFPNGYPVCAILFNDVIVGFTAIFFEGTGTQMTQAEMTGAKMLLHEVV